MSEYFTPTVTKAGEKEILSRLEASPNPQYLPDMGLTIELKGVSKTGEVRLEVAVTTQFGSPAIVYPEISLPNNGYVTISNFAKVSVSEA